MKKLLAVSIALNAAFVTAASLCWKGLAAHAASGGIAPAGNGDVNADGKIDVSDAVYLLSFLFQGGAAPKAIECPPLSGVRLPATGLTKCYNAAGEELDCNSVFHRPCLGGQDGFYRIGCPSAGRFVDNGDGTVTDNCTGLMWQKENADTDGDGKSTLKDQLPWCDAIAFCDNLKFAGHDDWRLPNVRELESIIDYGGSSISIDPVFQLTPSSLALQWSSTSHGVSPNAAWAVAFFGGGAVNELAKDTPIILRAVRTAQ